MLKNIPLFSGLGEAELAERGRHAVVRNYPKNTVIINEGDHSDSLYLIQDGRVKIYLADEQGKEIIINHQGPGEYFGELALLDDAARSASVMTLERSSFCVLSKDVLRDFLAHNPNVAIGLIKDLTNRVRALTDNVKSLALLAVSGRVAKTLHGLERAPAVSPASCALPPPRSPPRCLPSAPPAPLRLGAPISCFAGIRGFS